MSADSLLQVTVYTLILNGRFLRHRDDFEDALVQLSVARNLLDELADRAGTSRDQALATLFADDIGAEIRYCAHELGRSKAYDVDGIVKELAAKHRNEFVEGCDKLVAALKKEGEASGKAEVRKKLAAVEWEGQPVPVRNPELVDVLLKVQDAEARLGVAGDKGDDDKGKKKEGKGSKSKKGVAAYDAILLALSDAENVARKLVEAQQVCSLNAIHVVYSSPTFTVERCKHGKRGSRHSRHPFRSRLHRLPTSLPAYPARSTPDHYPSLFSNRLGTARLQETCYFKGTKRAGGRFSAVSCCSQAA